MIVSENQRPTDLQLYDRNGTHQDLLKWSFPQRYADSYVEALNHFFDVLEGEQGGGEVFITTVAFAHLKVVHNCQQNEILWQCRRPAVDLR